MTILLKIASAADCVVFSGDKRLSDRKGFLDTCVKATVLGTNGVGGATGHTHATHPETGVVQRDVHEQLRKFFDDRHVNDKLISEFNTQLRDVYQTYLNDHRGGKEQDNVECDLFWIVMTYFQDGRQIDCTISARVTTKDGLRAKERLFIPKKSVLLVFGDPNIKDAIRSGSTSLAELYSQKDIVALLNPPTYCEFGTVSVDRAVEICRLVTRVCSEKATEITGKPSAISPECDILILDKEGVRSA